jgi:hypothetical protein
MCLVIKHGVLLVISFIALLQPVIIKLSLIYPLFGLCRTQSLSVYYSLLITAPVLAGWRQSRNFSPGRNTWPLIPSNVWSPLAPPDQSGLIYDWWFTVNQFVLATNPLRLTTSIIFQLNACGHNLYAIPSLRRRCVCRLQLLLAFASSVILMSESRETHDHILLPQI